MTIPIDILRAAGCSDEQILRALELYRESRREYERTRKARQRANVPHVPRDTRGHTGTSDHTLKNNSSSKPSSKSREEPLATLWAPKEKHYDIGLSECRMSAPEVDRQAERYRDWLINSKRKHKDLDAGFRNWLRSNHQRHGGQNGQKRGSKYSGSVIDACDEILAELSDNGGKTIDGELSSGSVHGREGLRLVGGSAVLPVSRGHRAPGRKSSNGSAD